MKCKLAVSVAEDRHFIKHGIDHLRSACFCCRSFVCLFVCLRPVVVTSTSTLTAGNTDEYSDIVGVPEVSPLSCAGPLHLPLSL